MESKRENIDDFV